MVSFRFHATLAFVVLQLQHTTNTVFVHASRPFIAGFEPYSQVTDHNALDLDQEAIEQQLALASTETYANALRIYQEGAYSKMVAEIVLTDPLPTDIARGTLVSGFGAKGNQILGYAYEDNRSFSDSIRIRYKTSDDQNSYVLCQVGASQTPKTVGCFATNGTLTIGDRYELGYTYDPLSNNVAKRTIQKMSTSAEKRMYRCKNCPYVLYKAFVGYYGEFDYGNQIVLAAFEGKRTKFKNFNNDFGLYSFDGKEQIIKKATAYIIIWMYVIREMENALDDCNSLCTLETCNDDGVYTWDVAVAYYTGSLEGDNGSGTGKLAHALADKMCVNFRTCGDNADSTTGFSKVNVEINKNWKTGQGKLNKGECASAQVEKDRIERLMYIPLIQGTLRYAWKTDFEAYNEKDEAEGAVFAMAILPVVHRCNAEAAQTIASNLVVGQKGTADFAAVKQAFESVYDCIGVDPAMVGGLYDAATQSYYEGAEPAATGLGDAAPAPWVGVFVGACVAAATSLLLVVAQL